MNYYQLKDFLIFPELPDIISYLLYLIIIVCFIFIKAYVKKDNLNTLFKIEGKTKDLNKLIDEYNQEKSKLEAERKKMKLELKKIKEAIKQSSNNSHELVANGTASHIAEMLNDMNDKVKEEDLNDK